MTTPPYSDDDLTWAKQVMSQYTAVADTTVNLLVKACEQQDSNALAYLVKQVYERQDILLLNQVLAALTTRVVFNERRKAEDENPLWMRSVYDQCEAAIEHRELEKYARMAVDGNLRAAEGDRASGLTIDFDYAVTALQSLNHETTKVIAAEMLRRLANGGA
jgi:hypothetical protein